MKKHLIELYERWYVLARRLRFDLRYRFSVMPMEKTV